MQFEPYILVLYYSRTGGTAAMAEYIANGIESVSGISAKIRVIPPISSEETQSSVPFINIEELKNCSGLALGSPVRFGNMAAAVKYFLEQTSNLWLQGDLIGKPAAVFSSASTLWGGVEGNLLSMIVPLLQHGMLILGLPADAGAPNNLIHSAYGAMHISGSDNKNINRNEQQGCFLLGERLAKTAYKLFVKD